MGNFPKLETIFNIHNFVYYFVALILAKKLRYNKCIIYYVGIYII